MTDDDFHKSKGAFGQTNNLIFMSTHDGTGNITRLETSPAYKGLFQTVWSNDFGESWDTLDIGTAAAGLITGIFVEYMDGGYIQRIRFRDNRIYDLHVCESELCLYKSTDGCATWSKVWAVNITKC